MFSESSSSTRHHSTATTTETERDEEKLKQINILFDTSSYEADKIVSSYFTNGKTIDPIILSQNKETNLKLKLNDQSYLINFYKNDQDYIKKTKTYQNMYYDKQIVFNIIDLNDEDSISNAIKLSESQLQFINENAILFFIVVNSFSRETNSHSSFLNREKIKTLLNANEITHSYIKNGKIHYFQKIENDDKLKYIGISEIKEHPSPIEIIKNTILDEFTGSVPLLEVKVELNINIKELIEYAIQLAILKEEKTPKTYKKSGKSLLLGNFTKQLIEKIKNLNIWQWSMKAQCYEILDNFEEGYAEKSVRDFIRPILEVIKKLNIPHLQAYRKLITDDKMLSECIAKASFAHIHDKELNNKLDTILENIDTILKNETFISELQKHVDSAHLIKKPLSNSSSSKSTLFVEHKKPQVEIEEEDGPRLSDMQPF